MNRIYMDYAATTPVDQRVVDAMSPFWTQHYGNPSSIHEFGQEAMEAVDNARKLVANLIGAKTSEIVFTSGGSESDNAAVKGICNSMHEKGRHIITSAIEHHAVLHAVEFMGGHGFDVTVLPVDPYGLIDLDELEKAVRKDTILITIMHANNEVGTVQPIAEIGKLARHHEILFHTDAVQTVGHLPIDVHSMQIDLLSLSAHKFYGPKGSGALFVKEGIPISPLIHGGSQEDGRRSSTLNVPGIVGLGKAAEIAMKEMKFETAHILSLRKSLHDQIFHRIEHVTLNGHPETRLPNNLNLSIDHVEGESLLMNLDLEGIAASSGSACSSGSSDASHVLTALGLSVEHARGSLRLSLGKLSDKDEVDIVVDALTHIVGHLRSLSPFGKGNT